MQHFLRKRLLSTHYIRITPHKSPFFEFIAIPKINIVRPAHKIVILANNKWNHHIPEKNLRTRCQ